MGTEVERKMGTEEVRKCGPLGRFQVPHVTAASQCQARCFGQAVAFIKLKKEGINAEKVSRDCWKNEKTMINGCSDILCLFAFSGAGRQGRGCSGVRRSAVVVVVERTACRVRGEEGEWSGVSGRMHTSTAAKVPAA